MSSIEVQGVKRDEKLDMVLRMAGEATRTFIDAMKDMEDRMSFKAFTIRKFADDEDGKKMDAFIDLLQAAIVMHIEKIDKEISKHYNLDTSTEKLDDEVVVWLHARNKSDEHHSDEVQIEKEPEHPTTEVSIPHGSGIHAFSITE